MLSFKLLQGHERDQQPDTEAAEVRLRGQRHQASVDNLLRDPSAARSVADTPLRDARWSGLPDRRGHDGPVGLDGAAETAEEVPRVESRAVTVCEEQGLAVRPGSRRSRFRPWMRRRAATAACGSLVAPALQRRACRRIWSATSSSWGTEGPAHGRHRWRQFLRSRRAGAGYSTVREFATWPTRCWRLIVRGQYRVAAAVHGGLRDGRSSHARFSAAVSSVTRRARSAPAARQTKGASALQTTDARTCEVEPAVVCVAAQAPPKGTAWRNAENPYGTLPVKVKGADGDAAVRSTDRASRPAVPEPPLVLEVVSPALRAGRRCSRQSSSPLGVEGTCRSYDDVTALKACAVRSERSRFTTRVSLGLRRSGAPGAPEARGVTSSSSLGRGPSNRLLPLARLSVTANDLRCAGESPRRRQPQLSAYFGVDRAASRGSCARQERLCGL